LRGRDETADVRDREQADDVPVVENERAVEPSAAHVRDRVEQRLALADGRDVGEHQHGVPDTRSFPRASRHSRKSREGKEADHVPVVRDGIRRVVMDLRDAVHEVCK